MDSSIRGTPLARLLAINLAFGIALAAFLVGGLLLLNLNGLRDLIAADRSPVVAVVLLLAGFVVTFGSMAMGTAIMAIEASDGPGDGSPLRQEAMAPAVVKDAGENRSPRTRRPFQ